jgi:hypothetical protein
MPKENQTDKTNRRTFLSKSFKAVVSASMAIVATKVTAYKLEPGQDSTDVTLLVGGSTDVPPPAVTPPTPPPSRSWR